MTKLRWFFGRDHKDQGSVWHDKDPSLLKDHKCKCLNFTALIHCYLTVLHIHYIPPWHLHMSEKLSKCTLVLCINFYIFILLYVTCGNSLCFQGVTWDCTFVNQAFFFHLTNIVVKFGEKWPCLHNVDVNVSESTRKSWVTVAIFSFDVLFAYSELRKEF